MLQEMTKDKSTAQLREARHTVLSPVLLRGEGEPTVTSEELELFCARSQCGDTAIRGFRKTTSGLLGLSERQTIFFFFLA